MFVYYLLLWIKSQSKRLNVGLFWAALWKAAAQWNDFIFWSHPVVLMLQSVNPLYCGGRHNPHSVDIFSHRSSLSRYVIWNTVTIDFVVQIQTCFLIFSFSFCLRLCRKLHREMGKPLHVLCGQRVCCVCIRGHTHTHEWPSHAPKRSAVCSCEQQGAPKCRRVHLLTAVFSCVSRLQTHVNTLHLMYLWSHVTAVL